MSTILSKSRTGIAPPLLTLCALVWLAGRAEGFGQEPVAFDGSLSREMEVVWTRTFAPGESAFGAYLQNVGDVPNRNVVTVLVDKEYRTWPTAPILDTTANAMQWVGGRASKVTVPIDYDGIPPMEFSSNEFVFRPSADGKVMTAIDTVCLFPQGGSSDVNPRWASDVNNDGLLDIVSTNLSSPNFWFAALLSGAGRGEGCERTIMFPNNYPSRPEPERESTPVRLMRCSDGKLRIVYVGSIHRYKSGIYLLDVHVLQTDTGYTVTYTMADSVEQRWTDFGGEIPWIIRARICVDDAKNGHQYALVDWEDGWHPNHNTTVMYEVTNGQLVERVSTVGHLNFSMYTFDNAFDDGDAVVAYGGGGFTQFARITEFYRPFAKVKPGTTGSGFAFIDDQFNDGSRDLLTGHGNKDIPESNFIRLVNFDLRPTSIQNTDASPQSWVQLQAGRLRMSLERPSTISVEAVDAIGQKRPMISGFTAPAGPTTLDITSQLQTLPKGAWFIRVSDGVRLVSLSYLR